MDKLQKVWALQNENAFEVFADEGQCTEAQSIIGTFYAVKATQGYFITKEQLVEVIEDSYLEGQDDSSMARTVAKILKHLGVE